MPSGRRYTHAMTLSKVSATIPSVQVYKHA